MTKLSNFAAQTLQRHIHEGTYPPGAPLPSQRELSAALGISRASLREAVSTLEALGLVHAQPGRGVYVTGGAMAANDNRRVAPMADPRAAFQFRGIVEPAAAALTARHANPHVIDVLAATQTRMEDALRALDLVEASQADLDFHLALADASGNALLASAIRALEAPIAHSLRLPFADPAGVWAPADEHRAVLAAITARDAQGAQAAMQTHLARAAARIGLVLELP
jgi:GntR family transcriptional regulator, transcriptional repressor for pyruvate dehydrogenase complex